MERGWHGGQRRSIAVALALLFTLLLFHACTPPRQEAGAWIDGQLVDHEISIAQNTLEIALVLDLPQGFETAEGFSQRVTVSTAGGEEEYQIAAAGEVTVVPVPGVHELNMTLTIGFCSIKAKEICYVDRAEFTFTRTQPRSQQTSIEFRYAPEEPS